MEGMDMKPYPITLLPWRQQWQRLDMASRLLLGFCLLIVVACLAKYVLGGHPGSDSLLCAGLGLLSFAPRYVVRMPLGNDDERIMVGRYLAQKGFVPEAQGWVRRVLMFRHAVCCEGNVLVGPRLTIATLRRRLMRDAQCAG